MVLILKNSEVVGCQKDGHSSIFCDDCQLIDSVACPKNSAILMENSKKEKNRIFKSLGNDYEQVATEIAKLVTDKQLKYGNSFSFSYEIMKVLYPNGMTLEQMKDALVVVRIIDKLFRIANGNLGSEDAFSDITGYGLLSVVRNKK